MAETVASPLLGIIFEKLTDEALKKFARSQNIHSELNELKTTLSQVKALLNDASSKEVTNESVGLWLNNLQHLAYDIDDVLDDVATEAMHRELTPESGAITSKVRNLIVPTCCTNLSLSQSLHHKLDGITKRLQNLEKQKDSLGLIIVKDEKQRNTIRGNETSLLESNVIGREREKEKLLNKLLLDEASKENFSILPIVGMGGVGKTTLAKLLYNDARLKGQFELHAWVCVSDDFDIIKISKTIFQAVSGEIKEFEDLNLLQMALKEKLKDKRFLLVLDDVWTENYDNWENLVLPLHSVARGSRIIMTTRKEQLVKMIGFDHMHHLESLSDKNALSLFAIHALGVDNFDSHLILRPTGEAIVEKCGGLPLALKAIGRLLRTKKGGEDWEDVLNSEIWHLENADEIVPALRLSYHDLSSDLKQVFAYCSLFPKDFLFDKEMLVLLWMAEGYLNQSDANKSPERLGHEYFEKLLSRSFFQHAPNGESLFVMHDLMNDLATFVAGDYFLRLAKPMEMSEEALAKYRHISFIREEYVGHQKFESFKRAESLRTFLAVSIGVDGSWNHFYLSSKILVDFLHELRMLRVLCLSHFKINEVPDFIGSLKHLRYLNLAQTDIKELPENVGNLYNLQTLIVSGCLGLTKLPKSFVNLKKLRHFDIANTPLLNKLPLGIGKLKSLQTLTKIIIEGDNGFAITELKGLKNLHGKISIEGLQKVQRAVHAHEANLSTKGITKLELKWGDGSRREILENEVLNELKPHSDKLKMFVVKCYGGIKFPNWVGDSSFHQLVHVSISGCRKCILLPPLGQLPSLKELFIQEMYEVKIIGSDLTGTNVVAFPSLEILGFQNMSRWEVWSTKNKALDAIFPCLRELYIEKCPNLINVSLEALPSLRVLMIHECNEGLLRCLVQAASSITELKIESISWLKDVIWRDVIEFLGVVEEVSISKCNEIRYLWKSEAEASKFLVNLKKLKVSHCSSLVRLGEKKEEDNFKSNHLASLKVLGVLYCTNMERFCCPNNIESLSIIGCSSLTRVSFTEGGGKELKSFSVYKCNKLAGKINKTSMPMLEVIDINGWTNLKSIIQLSNSTHLTQLRILYCQSMESFPNLELANLTHLKIEDCQNLQSFPDLSLSNLTLLKHMVIKKCPRIDASFPRGRWPRKLLSLGIGGLKNPISNWDSQNFPSSLVDLYLFGENVSNFSQLSHILPSSLTGLGIYEFDKLESLSTGLQHLTSIQHLVIEKCPKMKHLPKTLLPSLLRMGIYECQNLKERCNGKGSYYWPLISHIPWIDISN